MYIKPSRDLALQPHRNAWVEINIAALEHNARWWRRFIPPHMDAMAVVKADAYGHGAVLLAPVLRACGFRWLGVSNIDEALQLREAGIEMPVLVLGASPEWGWPLASRNDIRISICSREELHVLAHLPFPLKVHIKVDTGMHRLGCSPEETLHVLHTCEQMPHIEVEGLFTHFACGEDPRHTATQWNRFLQQALEALPALPPFIHASNTPSLLASASSLPHYETSCTLARVGIGLYGYETDDAWTAAALQPVMGLKARISHISCIPAGEGVSYGHRWKAPEADSCIVTVPMGYADGIPRPLSGKIEALWQGERVPQVGNITMDQMMFHLPQASLDAVGRPPALGDVLTLLHHGEAGRLERQKPLGTGSLSMSHWAHTAGTIPYETMCGLRVRLSRSVVR
jgi:alanine racemase